MSPSLQHFRTAIPVSPSLELLTPEPLPLSIQLLVTAITVFPSLLILLTAVPVPYSFQLLFLQYLYLIHYSSYSRKNI
jgi:hypothetical protein